MHNTIKLFLLTSPKDFLTSKENGYDRQKGVDHPLELFLDKLSVVALTTLQLKKQSVLSEQVPASTEQGKH
ncbi:Deubiquitination-protection protein dph1 [Senna tora]|uniref:Deubiquitination-protection protein dph1 n=1 Tax=Senna tora TaxID=362788 RepID=A0A834SPE0_9FABA|nr:Deubiquitination-protection protein dph1 [Senna tora]